MECYGNGINKQLRNLVGMGTIALAAFAVLGTLPQTSTRARAEGNAETGEKIFKKCAACHRIGEGAKNATGPVLTGVIGRKAASFEGYSYGKAPVEPAKKDWFGLRI